MHIQWSFLIAYYKGEERFRPLSIGLQLRSAQEVEGIADLLEVDLAGRGDQSVGRQLRVELFEGDPQLRRLLKHIKDRYGCQPSESFVVPLEKRERCFGVRKIRQYEKQDLDRATFLHLDFAAEPIATQIDGTNDQVESEVYVGEADDLQSSTVQFGNLMPFHGLCVSDNLGRQLEQAGLQGLSLENALILPEQDARKALKKLSSSVIAPRSLLPLVNDQGHAVAANTEWPCYLDDGYQPHEFKYGNTDLDSFRGLDIAVSYERTGVSKARAFRWCLISQRFRQVMRELQIPGVRYAPVRFLCEAGAGTPV
jgi:hypothetical protein